jgi:uncharacterized damage-inducible protein DinB
MGGLEELCHFLSLAYLLGNCRLEAKLIEGNLFTRLEIKIMKKPTGDLDLPQINLARRTIAKVYLPRIERCLKLLSEEEIWWRPNPASNSVGNLTLHLVGNVRQWINSGLGGELDKRDRNREFAERGPIPRRSLLALLRNTVAEADRVLGSLNRHQLRRRFSIQRFEVTGSQAIWHVAEHFAFHSGQIIYITKLKRGIDLEFTRLKGEQAKTEKKSYSPF